MKIKNLLFVPIFSLLLFFGHRSEAQIILGTSPYTQDFNSIGTSGLPAGWTGRTGASPTALGTAVTFSNASIAWNNSTGAFKNFASATGLNSASIATDQNASGNRAFGLRQTGAVADPGGAFVLQLDNTTGSSNFSLSFKLQSLDGGTLARTAIWKVDYGFGAAPSSFTVATSNPVTLSTTLSPAGWGSTDVTVNFGTALDNSAGNVWIRIVTLSATTGSGSRPSTAIDDVQLSYAAGDISPPVFTSTYPKTSILTTTGFDLLTNLSEQGKTYFVVLADGATAPTSSQVKNGFNASGNTSGVAFSGSINVLAASTEYGTTSSGLNSDTDYDIYAVAEDNIPNIQAAPIKLDVRTIAIGDVTPPSFTSLYPKVDGLTPTGFTVRTNLDELGKTYFAVLPGGAPTPTAPQVKDGHDANDIAIAGNRIGTINVTTTNTEFTSVISSLSANSSYDVYFVAEDNVPNLQANPTKISVQTGKLFVENFNNCDGTSSFSSYSAAGDQVWGCVDFGYNATKGLRMNGFLGSAVANEDWLISPVLTLSANASLSFYSQFSFAGPGLQLKISTDYAGSGNPNSATWTSLNGNFPAASVGSTSTAISDWTLSNVDLSAYAGNVFVAFVYTSTVGTNTAARWTLDEINVNNATASYFQATPSALSFKTSGAVKSYSLNGVNLQNDVTVTAPTNFSVSKDNAAFSNSITFTAAQANAQPAVYVKFTAPGATADTYTGTITNVSAGVASKDVLVKGTDLSLTFDVACYNLEFFGTDVKDASNVEFGPLDDALQVANVSTVLNTIGADIFGVEEIADDNAFNQLLANLPGYDKIVSPRWSYSFDPPDPNFPPQKVAFIYNTSTVNVVSSRVMFVKLYDDIKAGTVTLPNYPGGTSSSFWSSGRLPFMVTVDVTINGFTKRVRMIDIHAKSGSAAADYDRRKFDVQVLHDSLTANYPNDNIILVGDYNDLVEGSIYAGHTSTYKPFIDNAASYNALTYNLSLSGASTFPSSSSFIDHIIISNELTSSYVPNSIYVEDPRNYVSNYTNTTSDHLPVVARFLLTKDNQTITFGPIADKTVGDLSFPLSATATSGLVVGFGTTSDKITLNATQVTIVKAGRATITATQPGNSTYNAALPVDQSFCIKPAKPTITLSNANTTTPVLTSSAATGNQWYLNGTIIPGATNATLSVTGPGVYKVQIKVDDCVSAFSNDTPIIFTGDLSLVKSIVVYPNPVSDYLEVRGIEHDVTSAQVIDMMGRSSVLILEKNGETHRGLVDYLSTGMYILRVGDGLAAYQTKFIKK